MECSGLSDQELVARILEGDTALGNDFVERMQPVVSKIVRGRVTRRSEEQDLTQAVFLNVFSNLHQYSGKAPLEHWVSRIAVNVCLNQYRHDSRRPELRRADLSAEQDDLLDSLATSEADVLPGQQMAANELVTMLLENLTGKERLIMTLHYLDGLSLSEVAERTGMSNLALRLVAFRARRKMQNGFEKLQKGKRL
jgi:RNA polymerase sigma-70 factor (ECF subfamily)